MHDADRQRRIADYDEMERTCSFGADKDRFRASAAALRVQESSTNRGTAIRPAAARPASSFFRWHRSMVPR